MLPTRRPLRNSIGEIWEQNASTLQRLYEVERKTLKEVKQIMEEEHGFPIVPLSTYEITLRDEFGLRKKLKRRDWHAVYQHHLSSGGKHTGVYLNGTKIPWKKAWKEIRRSGARSIGECRYMALPAGVIMRTPSPPLIQAHEKQSMGSAHSPSLPLVLRQHSPPISGGVVTCHSQKGAQLAQNHSHSLTPIHSPGQVIRALNILQLAFENNSVALQNVPWIMFTEKVSSLDDAMLRTPDRCNETWGAVLNLDFMGGSMMNIEMRRAAFLSNIFPFSYPAATYSAPAINFDIYHFLADTIYLISNKLLPISPEDDYNEPCPDMIYILLTRVPQGLLAELLQIDLHTIRVVWELLAHCAGNYGYLDAFKFLMHIGLQHSGWILPGGPAYLSFAASMGAHDIIRDLLKIGVRADDMLHACKIPAIVEATATGNLECVKLLAEYCDVNRIILIKPVILEVVIKHSNFSFFLSTLMDGRYVRRMSQSHGYPNRDRTIIHFSLEDEAQNQALSILLDGGANVDLPWENFLGSTDESTLDLSEFHSGGKTPKEWRVTILERSYFWNKELFNKLVPYSTQAKEGIIRPYIYRSAKQGKESLREYLKLADSGFDVTAFLEFVIAEIFVAGIEIDAGVVRGLLEFGVDPNLPTLPLDIDYLLYCLLERRSKCSDFGDVLMLLLQSGAVIGPEILQVGVEQEGIDILLLLSQHGASVSQYGAMALVKAACLNNYEAVSWLLEAGVDINSTRDSLVLERQSVIALVTIGDAFQPQSRWKVSYTHRKQPANCDMLRYLIQHGAVLKKSPHDPNSFEFLDCVLRHNQGGNPIYERFKLFLEQLSHCDLLNDEGCLYGAIFAEVMDKYDEKLSIFNLLLSRGVPIRAGSVLPSLILLEISSELVQDLLEAGIGINDYSGKMGTLFGKYTPIQAAAFRGNKALVERLLRMGADINQSAYYHVGRTALQAACEWNAQSTAEKARKIETIQYLLEEGAQVNARPAVQKGFTALQIAAMNGDMEVVLLLVEARADLNAPPAAVEGFCALDGAAHRGRLDMVQFLLNIGALSYSMGETGYDGAIQLAEDGGHFTVADLIRQHAKKELELVGANLAMSFYEEGKPDGWDPPVTVESPGPGI